MLERIIAISLAASVAGAFLTGAAFAAADLEYGEYLSGECVTCHSATGADKGIPSITGWDAESFVLVMKAYKSKERENPVMQIIASRLDDEQMAALAAYFATLPEGE